MANMRTSNIISIQKRKTTKFEGTNGLGPWWSVPHLVFQENPGVWTRVTDRYRGGIGCGAECDWGKSVFRHRATRGCGLTPEARRWGWVGCWVPRGGGGEQGRVVAIARGDKIFVCSIEIFFFFSWFSGVVFGLPCTKRLVAARNRRCCVMGAVPMPAPAF